MSQQFILALTILFWYANPRLFYTKLLAMPKLKPIDQSEPAPIEGNFKIVPPAAKPTKRKHDLNALHALVVSFGPRQAARLAGIKECTMLKLASRNKWHQAQDIPGKPGRKPKPLPYQLPAPGESHLPLSPNRHQSPGEVLGNALTRLKSKSTMALATYSATAASALNKVKDPLSVTRKAVDISDVHKSIWPAETPNQNILQIGFLVQGK